MGQRERLLGVSGVADLVRPNGRPNHWLFRPSWPELEPLWITALALLIIVPGYRLGASVIQFFGRGGRTETVESLVYLSVLLCFPIAASIVAYLLPASGREASADGVKAGLLLFLVALAALYVARGAPLAIASACGMAVVTAALLGPRVWGSGDAGNDSVVARRAVLLFGGTAAWMGAGALVSWGDATGWFTSEPIRFGLFCLTFGLWILALRPAFTDSEHSRVTLASGGAVAVIGALLLIVLSFRTNPVLELYHWEAFVGPMQEVRQGGWLLWDNPAQYGVLSILLPTLFPGNAWQSFYLFQGLCNVVIALLMFRALRGVRPSVTRDILAIALAATTLFFRPRTATLLLAGQMTPSGGPVRFIWSFVMLAFVFGHYRQRSSVDGVHNSADTRFAIWGNAIWIVSALWSVEAAIYCTAIWFPAYGAHLFQQAFRDRLGGATMRTVATHALWQAALPLTALATLVVLISAAYRLTLGHFPDWMGYVEYAVLYGGGFRALPIDPSGSVWFLLTAFLAISTACVIYVAREPSRPHSIVLVGAWGGVWAISSYFVSRSHPANLLSITAFVIFALAITLGVMEQEGWEGWHGVVLVAAVPIFTVPIVLTIAHPGFATQIATPQLSYGRFTEQIPLMEPSLNQLLLQAGAKPTDPIVRIGDGRLMLAAWRPPKPGEPRVVSPYSWLPKQYEIIGTLPAARRRQYISRLADHLRLSGWLVHSRRGGITDFAQQLADISRTHVEIKRFENADWIVSWYQLRKR